MPIGRAGRHVQTRDILFLMTGAALLTVLTKSVNAAPNVLCMNVIVVALSGEISGRMAVQAAWMFEHRND
jgi:hypothetical protein